MASDRIAKAIYQSQDAKAIESGTQFIILANSPIKKQIFINLRSCLNYSKGLIAMRHYSYAVLQKQLNSMMINFFGTQIPQHLKRVMRYLTERIREDS